MINLETIRQTNATRRKLKECALANLYASTSAAKKAHDDFWTEALDDPVEETIDSLCDEIERLRASQGTYPVTSVLEQIAGLLPPDSNTKAVLEAFKREMEEHGIPELLKETERRRQIAQEARSRVP